MRTPGIEVRPLPNMTERHEFNEVFFTDVRVPLDQMVMGRGDGWRVAMVNLKHERGKLGDPNKLTQRLHRLVRLLEESRCDGRPLIELPSYRDRLLDIQGQVLAWKAHSLRLLTDQARDQGPGVGAMIVKYGGTSLLWRMSALAVDALGAAGLSYELHEDETEDDPATTWNADYMYDIAMLIGGGTSNIQKNIIGERGLGLPAGPKGDASRSAAGVG
jgi:alkylation response protein AidB-like acyl-CoA dehydrogenase